MTKCKRCGEDKARICISCIGDIQNAGSAKDATRIKVLEAALRELEREQWVLHYGKPWTLGQEGIWICQRCGTPKDAGRHANDCPFATLREPGAGEEE